LDDEWEKLKFGEAVFEGKRGVVPWVLGGSRADKKKKKKIPPPPRGTHPTKRRGGTWGESSHGKRKGFPHARGKRNKRISSLWLAKR